MYRIVTVAALLLSLAPQPAAADDHSAVSERRVALVIGNAGYRSVPVLRSPQRDAAAVAAALQQVGFQTVQLATDLDRDGMAKALEAFHAQADAADWALVYYAGHGIEIDKVNYLIPVDAKLTDYRSVKDETVPYEAVLKAIDGARALRIVVLDASRANPFKENTARSTASQRPAGGGLAPPPEPKPGTVVVYAAKAGEVAVDDADGSPFARAFAAEITKPGVEVRRMFDYVRDDVLDATNNRQQPFTYSVLAARRDFIFAPRR
jgi:uncharacterized caspase-like protein